QAEDGIRDFHVTGVQTCALPILATRTRKGDGYATALWGLDPRGEQPAYRITRSAKGEAGAAFASTGDLYFTSARPNPEDDEAEPDRKSVAQGKSEASRGHGLDIT